MAKRKKNKKPADIPDTLVKVATAKAETTDPAARDRLHKAESDLQHEYAMQHSQGYINEVARRKAEGTLPAAA